MTNALSPWDASAGGGQAATDDLARALAARGHDLRAVYAGQPAKLATPYPVDWVRRSPRPLVTAVRIARRVRMLALDTSPDVIHASGFEAAYLPRPRLRAMTTHHPDFPRWAPPSWARPWSRLQYLRRQQVAWLEREGLRKADLAFFVSASAQGQAAARGYPTPRPRVVPNGVDAALFSPAPDRGRAHPPTVVFAGRMDDQKGVDILLRAVSLLSPPPRLRLIGGGWKGGAYRQLAAELGLGERAEFLGQVPRRELPELLRSASVVAVPSRYENLPLSVLEGMACGVPVVVSRVGGVPEMIEDGVEGTLVPAEAPEALAAALDQLLEDPALAARMGAAGRRRVLAEFTWESVAARTEACYREFLG